MPAQAHAALVMLAHRWQVLDGDIKALEQQIVRSVRADEAARRIMAIPGRGPDHRQRRGGGGAGYEAVPLRTRLCRLAWVDPAAEQQRLDAPFGRHLQAGSARHPLPADPRRQLAPAPGEGAKRMKARDRSLARRPAGAPAGQGRGGGASRQDRPGHLGLARQEPVLPRASATTTRCLTQQTARRHQSERATARDGKRSGTGIGTLRTVIAPRVRRDDWNPISGIPSGPAVMEPHTKAGYMTAPDANAAPAKMPLPRGGRPYMTDVWVACAG